MGSHGDILFGTGAGSGLRRVREGGGPVETVTDIDTARHEQSHRFPWFLPDDRRFLYTVNGNPAVSGVYWANLDDGERRRLEPEVSMAVYDPRGFLVFVRQGTLLAQRFDAEAGELSGEAAPIAEDVGVDPRRPGSSSSAFRRALELLVVENAIVALHQHLRLDVGLTDRDLHRAVRVDAREQRRPHRQRELLDLGSRGIARGDHDVSDHQLEIVAISRPPRLAFGDAASARPELLRLLDALRQAGTVSPRYDRNAREIAWGEKWRAIQWVDGEAVDVFIVTPQEWPVALALIRHVLPVWNEEVCVSRVFINL